MIVEWPVAEGRRYDVYWTDNLRYTPFSPLETNLSYPRAAVTNPAASARGFYKVEVAKP